MARGVKNSKPSRCSKDRKTIMHQNAWCFCEFERQRSTKVKGGFHGEVSSIQFHTTTPLRYVSDHRVISGKQISYLRSALFNPIFRQKHQNDSRFLKCLNEEGRTILSLCDGHRDALSALDLASSRSHQSESRDVCHDAKCSKCLQFINFDVIQALDRSPKLIVQVSYWVF
ncbi:LAFA_0C06634g1_1 [Lachancea sp. 'fantastica']|nr:LAFA_0C06634g1_1 [Lachancea sp. 'fantastica']